MIAAGTETGILKEWRQELCERNRSPDHQNHQRHKPLQQVHTVGFHHVDAQQHDEHRNQEGRQSKAALDEIPRHISTHTTTGIAEFMVLVQHFSLARIFNQTLVGRACREIGYERQDEIERDDNQNNADHEVQFLILEYIFYTYYRGKA